jgi:hypothetical protein
MAFARISRSWPDGDVLECEVCVEESYPDAVAEAVARARDLFRAGVSVVLGDDD